MKRRRALPPYVSEDVAQKTGQVRLYYRRPGIKIRIWPSVEQEGFWPAYEAAKQGIQLPKPAKAPKKRQTTVRTFDKVCEDYFRSAEFLQLSAVGQRNRKGILKHCREDETKAGSGLRMGDTPIEEFGHAHVKALRDRKGGTPEAANNRVKALRGLFKWHLSGKPNAVNPCAGFGKLKSKNPGGFHAWTMDEVAAFERHHVVGTTPRLAFDLALYTAQRRSDVVKLGPGNVTITNGIGWLIFRQGKTRAEVEIPIIEPLAASLAARPDKDSPTFLMTSFGKPFTANGIGNAFREWCDEAGLPHCTMHGLRKATASRLAELGVNESGIGAVTGHALGSKELSIYIRTANRKLLAGAALKKLQESLPKPNDRLSHSKIHATENGTDTEEKRT